MHLIKLDTIYPSCRSTIFIHILKALRTTGEKICQKEMFNVYCNNINSNNTYCYPVGENWSALSMNVCHLGECTTPLMSREFPTLPWWDSLGSRALFPLDELTIPDSCVPSSLTAQMSAFISSVPQVLSLGP